MTRKRVTDANTMKADNEPAEKIAGLSLVKQTTLQKRILACQIECTYVL